MTDFPTLNSVEPVRIQRLKRVKLLLSCFPGLKRSSCRRIVYCGQHVLAMSGLMSTTTSATLRRAEHAATH